GFQFGKSFSFLACPQTGCSETEANAGILAAQFRGSLQVLFRAAVVSLAVEKKADIFVQRNRAWSHGKALLKSTLCGFRPAQLRLCNSEQIPELYIFRMPAQLLPKELTGRFK